MRGRALQPTTRLTLMSATCYMCAAPATTVEHAPPKMFFPAAKDLAAGVDYRKNLIAVPSCAPHNTASSKDDEYAVVVVAAHFENSSVARDHYDRKIRRALQRSAPFVARVFREPRRVQVDGRPALAFRIDDQRFERVMDKTARALYFHHFGQKWLARLRVHGTSFVQSSQEQPALERTQDMEQLRTLGEMLFTSARQFGENPDVFYYQVVQQPGRTIMRLMFYRGFEVYVLD